MFSGNRRGEGSSKDEANLSIGPFTPAPVHFSFHTAPTQAGSANKNNLCEPSEDTVCRWGGDNTLWLLRFLFRDMDVWKWTRQTVSIPKGEQTTQFYSPKALLLCVFLSLSAKTNYLMSHLQLATTRQLGLYSRAGDVFSSGIYSPHCCPARKTSSRSPTAPPR